MSRFHTKRKPLSNTITYKSTLIPTFAFLNGIKQPQPSVSIAVAGIGLVHNTIFSPNHRPYGVLQRLGIASVLSSSSQGSVTGPLMSVALWNVASIYFSENPQSPYASPGGTGQTRIDRAVVGKDHMLNPNWDPDGLLATLMTGVSMWIGSWCARNMGSKNDAFVSGLSLFSMGYLFSYAFPEKLPFSETFWTLSFTLGTSGLSLIKWTISDGLCEVLSRYAWGTHMLSGLEILGSHTVELFLISSTIDQLGITDQVESLRPGWSGKALSLLFKNGVMMLSGWTLHLMYRFI